MVTIKFFRLAGAHAIARSFRCSYKKLFPRLITTAKNFAKFFYAIKAFCKKFFSRELDPFIEIALSKIMVIHSSESHKRTGVGEHDCPIPAAPGTDGIGLSWAGVMDQIKVEVSHRDKALNCFTFKELQNFLQIFLLAPKNFAKFLAAVEKFCKDIFECKEGQTDYIFLELP